MEESVTYQSLLKHSFQRGFQMGFQLGAIMQGRKMLRLASQPKLGLPSPAVGAKIDAIADLVQLESLVGRIHAASTWDELRAVE